MGHSIEAFYLKWMKRVNEFRLDKMNEISPYFIIAYKLIVCTQIYDANQIAN